MQAILIPVLIICGIGLLVGGVLTIAAKYMDVPVDDRVTNVRAALPGANCGACGFAGCDEYAEKLVNEGVKANLCTPGGAEVAANISALLGVEAEAVIPMRAIVKCSGTPDATEYSIDYQGVQSCEACNAFYQGRGSCSYACLGYGDCVLVCQYDAIHIVDGIAHVDRALCTGCSMCAKACPKHLIEMVPQSCEVYVACSSTDKGAFVRKVCKAGCIGCMKCQEVCPHGAITVQDNLASVDPERCLNCGACVEQCPTGVIHAVTCPLSPNATDVPS